MEYKVETEVNKNDLIRQTITYELDGTIEQISQNILDAKEEQLKKALIELGWTPPGERATEGGHGVAQNEGGHE